MMVIIPALVLVLVSEFTALPEYVSLIIILSSIPCVTISIIYFGQMLPSIWSKDVPIDKTPFQS